MTVVAYQVRTGLTAPRTLAAVRGVTTRAQLGAEIIRLLDQVWPVLREQGARTGHNVVVYYPGEPVPGRVKGAGVDPGAARVQQHAGITLAALVVPHGNARQFRDRHGRSYIRCGSGAAASTGADAPVTANSSPPRPRPVV